MIFVSFQKKFPVQDYIIYLLKIDQTVWNQFCHCASSTTKQATKIWWERKLERINHLLKCLQKRKTSTELFCKKECKTCFFILVLSVKHRFSFCSSLSVCPISTMLPGQKGIKDRSSQKKKRVSTCGKTSSFHKKCLILALPLYFGKSTWWNRVKYVCFFTF